METDKPAGASGMTSGRGDHTGTESTRDPSLGAALEPTRRVIARALRPLWKAATSPLCPPHPEASVAVKHPTWFTVFITVAMLHLAGQLFGQDALHLVTKPLLMPALLAWFLTATPRSRFRTFVAVGLAWSWLGDLGLMPSGEAWFLAGLGAFLIAQVTYGVAFWPSRADSVLARPLLALPYLAVPVGLMVLLWDHLGDLRLPVAVYAVVIVAMAVLATGVNRTVAVGAALFVVSDALIALDSVAGLVRLPAHGFWVMLTYLAAQLLIAVGVTSAVRGDTAGCPQASGQGHGSRRRAHGARSGHRHDPA
jgi:uncharacterized membrane protein YhhN